MKLEPHQIVAVKQWYSDGATLSALQQQLKSEFNLSLTYLEVRLLAAELNLTREEPDPSPIIPLNALEVVPPPPANAKGKVSVTMDAVQRPGALLSGRATFSDGQSAEWYVDQSGRLALNPSQPGYRPSKSDVMAFQMELEGLASRQSF